METVKVKYHVEEFLHEAFEGREWHPCVTVIDVQLASGQPGLMDPVGGFHSIEGARKYRDLHEQKFTDTPVRIVSTTTIKTTKEYKEVIE